MNIFILGAGLSHLEYIKACAEVNEILNIYPQLKENEKFTYVSNDFRNFLFLVFSSKKIRGSREFVSEDDEHILFYSGLPIDPTKTILAHKAVNILRDFNNVKYKLEGQASIIRINKKNFDIDIITDTLSIEQVYYEKCNNGILLSNTIAIIKNVLNNYEIDERGVSYYLSFGFPVSDSTLTKNIKVIPGGQHWKWGSLNRTIIKKTYFDFSTIKPDSRKVLSKHSIKDLVDNFNNLINVLSDNFELECPLTGGFDSRLITAFLISNEINTSYYTVGNPLHSDVKIASLISRKFNLPYKQYDINYESLETKWDEKVKTFLMQTDGLVSIWQIFGMLGHTEVTSPKKVRLGTIGAELARVTYNSDEFLLTKFNESDLYDFLSRRLLVNYNGLITQTAIENHNKYVKNFINTAIEKGVYFKQVPDLFYAIERLSKFRCNVSKRIGYVADCFSLTSTKLYIERSFTINPIDKFSYPLHRKMMFMLNRKLAKLPFLKGSWPVQNRKFKSYIRQFKSRAKSVINIEELRKTISKKSNVNKNIQIFDRERIFRNKLNVIRSVCFDQRDSLIWEFINKKKLERILYEKDGYKIEYRGLGQLYTIVTLFYNELLNNNI